MVGIHNTLQGIGYGLLVLFFAVGVVKTCGSFAEVKRPEHALKLFVRFVLAKAAVTYGLELMLAVFRIFQGVVSAIISRSGAGAGGGFTLPQEIIDQINDVGFWESIPLWAVTLIGGLFITVLSFTMILTVYGRMFSLYMYAAIAPLPLATFAACGFLTYHGMTAEQLLWAWIKSEVLFPKRLVYRSDDLYWQAMQAQDRHGTKPPRKRKHRKGQKHEQRSL